MKFRLLHIVIIVLFVISSVRLFSQIEGPEYFEENISIPGGAITDGINPEDIIFADNKYFVAGLGTVLVLDADFTVVNTIHLSERGQYGYDALTVVYNLPPHSLMAYNGNHKLFVLSPDNEICIINTEGIGSLDTYRIPKPNCVPNYNFYKSIIRYQPITQRLFWVISWDIPGNPPVGISYLGYYNANSNTLIWDNSSALYSPNEIYDIEVNNLYNYFYLARKTTIEVAESDIGYYHAVTTINSGSNHKELLYIQTEELHGIYCCTQAEIPTANIYWIDGNDNTTKIFLAPLNILHGMTYNPDNHELYLGGGARIYYCDGINPQGYDFIMLPPESGDISSLEFFHNIIYVSTPSNIISITGSNHSIETELTKQNNYFGYGAYDSENDNVVITNMEGASLEIFNAQGHSNLLTGVSVYKSCYNPDDGKFYFYSDELRDYSKIAIIKHDMSDNTYNLDDIISYDLNGSERNISSCIYNESANHVLISSYSETNKIIKRHGNNNLDAGFITLANEFCENVFITPPPDNKIYCATAMNSLSDASIEIFDASNYSPGPVPVLNGFGSGYENSEFRTKFCYNAKDNDVYFILFSRATQSAPIGKLIKIDLDNGYAKTIYDILENPDKIIYCEACNQIYIKYRDVNYITQFDCNRISNQRTDWAWNSSIIDIEYGKYLNQFYILYEGNTVNDFDSIQIHHCSQLLNERWPIWAVPANCISIKYNELSHRVYAYSTDAHIDDMQYETHITVFDGQYSSDKDDLPLHNSECDRIGNHSNYNDLTIDPVSGYLLIPNGSHSNISVIRCPEKFELTRSINWISFPRLDRNPQNDEEISSVEALTDRILPGPWYTYTGHMNYLAYDPVHPQTGLMTSIDKYNLNTFWNTSGGLEKVYSNRGYQLEVTPDQNSIYFYGQIQNPTVPVNLHGTSTDRFCNWVGYYLTYPQSPFDAIPENILDNLRFMAGQYWSCVYNDPIPDNPGSGCWWCAINQGGLKINYGDMVKLTSISSNSFTWQQNNSNEPSIDKLKAESFTYTEQYDYDAIFIELDTNDIPSEIGAFAGDSCIGATKVLPGDTTVLICAYTEGFEGEDITFEFSYVTKTVRADKPDYFVFNLNTGKSERRLIKVEEEQSYHFVSFKSIGDNPINAVSSKLNCYPNPATDAFNVTYYVPKNGYVKIEILNSLGIKVIEKQIGYQTQGNHTYDMHTVGLPIGYYFVRIYTADQFYVGTLLINH